MKILAIIPARSGSKGIPNKNIVDLGGKPLIAWTIQAARACKMVDKVVVSTDDPKIAEISNKYGAEVPFIRPSHLAGDRAASIDVDLHAIDWLEKNEGYFSDFLVHLQPTSPFRTAKDISNAILLLKKKKADSIISLCAVSEHPNWMKCVNKEGKITDFLKNGIKYENRQELPNLYRLNGAIYLVKTDLFKEKRDWYFEKTYAYIMSQESSVDIDEPFDLEIARLLISKEHLK